LTLSGGGVNNSQTVAFTISTDNLQTWNGSFISSGNSLDLGTGAVTLDANLTVTVNVNTLTVGGIIDDGASTYAMNKAGAGTLSLTAVNTYGGGTTNSAGTILIDGDATLGTGTLTMAGGSLTATAAHASEAAGGIYLTSDGIIGSSAGETTKQLYFGGSVGGDNGTRMLTFTNHANAGAFVARLNGGGFTCGIKLDLQGGSGTISLQLYNTTGTDQQFDGVISGNGNVTRSASVGGTGGRTILTAANTYSGGTAVNDGILLVNNGSGSGTGTGAVTVGSGGTLGGTGAISGAITVGSGGRLAPGTSIGTLTADGNVTLEAGSGTGMEIDRNSGTELADLVTGIDTLTEGGTLYVTNNGATLQIGDEFTLFSATTYSGQFAAFSPANPNSDAELAWDTNALATLGMLKVHHTSYATNKTVVRGSGTSIKIPKAILFPTTDPLDADTVSLASLGASAEGAAITSDSTHILYSPANNNSDSFDYTVGDGRGGNRTATITVDVTNSVGAVTITATNANSMTVAAWAIPGYSYAIERDSNANMSTPETIYTTNLPSNSGLITYTEDPPYPSTFYRIRTN
jgi:autotransporter-associated beta strand protein